MVFARRQPAKRVRDFLPRQFHRVCDVHSFDHFCEHGTAGECWRAAVSEKARGFDATITNAQTQPQTIAADWVRLLRRGVRLREFAGIARMRQMIFESF